MDPQQAAPNAQAPVQGADASGVQSAPIVQPVAPVAPVAPIVQPAAQPPAQPPAPVVKPEPVKPEPVKGDADLSARISNLEAQLLLSRAQAVLARANVAGAGDAEIEALFIDRFKASGQQDFSTWFEGIKANPPAVLKPFLTPATQAQPGSRIVSAVNPGAQSGQGTAAEYTPEQIRELGKNPVEWAKHKDAVLAQLRRGR